VSKYQGRRPLPCRDTTSHRGPAKSGWRTAKASTDVSRCRCRWAFQIRRLPQARLPRAISHADAALAPVRQ
jgi:hypothetical protein